MHGYFVGGGGASRICGGGARPPGPPVATPLWTNPLFVMGPYTIDKLFKISEMQFRL